MRGFLFSLLMLITFSAMAQQTGTTIEKLQNEKDPEILQQKIKALENGSAEDLFTLVQYYRRDSVNRARVAKILYKKYPNSESAKMTRMTSFLQVEGVKESEALLQSMIRDFPNTNLDMEKSLVSSGYAEVPDTAKVMRVINTMEDPVFRVRALSMAIDAISGFNNEMALALASGDMKNVLKLKGQTTPSVALKIDPRAAYNDYINKYSKMLFNAGKYDEAYKYATEAYKNIGSRDSELAQNYAYLSALNGVYDEALPVLSKAVRGGKNDRKFIELVKKAYLHLHPGKDADAYIAELRNEFVTKIKNEVAELLIDETAPDFKVTDVNGKEVTLADFKGKTIVIDFWATWCGPCVASFPAMQMAVNRYVDDPEVKFLFIHTWDNVKDPLADATGFLKKHNYPFDLYMDLRDPVTKHSAAADSFKVKGIPAKFVIDPDGNIRFSVSGFSGTDEAAAEELVQMIEMARDTHPVSWKIKSEKIDALTYKIKFEVSVKEPYHIYPQEGGGMGSPTEITIENHPDIELIGKMEERGVNQKDDEELPYYEKGATFTQTVKLRSDKKTTLNFTINYMACTHEMCLPPANKKFSLTLN